MKITIDKKIVRATRSLISKIREQNGPGGIGKRQQLQIIMIELEKIMIVTDHNEYEFRLFLFPLKVEVETEELDEDEHAWNVSHETLCQIWDASLDEDDVIIKSHPPTADNITGVIRSQSATLSSGGVRAVILRAESDETPLVIRDQTNIKYGHNVSSAKCLDIVSNALMFIGKNLPREAFNQLHFNDDGNSFHFAGLNNHLGYVTRIDNLFNPPYDGKYLDLQSFARSGVELWRNSLAEKQFTEWRLAVHTGALTAIGKARNFKVLIDLYCQRQEGAKFNPFEFFEKKTASFQSTWEFNRKELQKAIKRCQLIQAEHIRLFAEESLLKISAENDGRQFDAEISLLRGGRKKEQGVLLNLDYLAMILKRIATDNVVVAITPGNRSGHGRMLCIWSGQNHSNDMFVLMPMQDFTYKDRHRQEQI